MRNCKNCKEQNEESFDICWKCGYGVDGETPNKINKKDTNGNRYFKVVMLLILVSLIYISFYIYQNPSKKKNKSKDDINATMINIYGKTDKRLKLSFISTYRPKSNASNPACKSYLDINTATKRVPLRAESRTIENQDEYNITIPVYNKDMRSKCEYEFVGISVRVERMYEKEGKYASVPILSDSPIFIGHGTKTGQSSSGDSFHAEMRQKYFRMPNGKRVSCFTEFYERRKGDSFTCDLNFREEIEGVNQVVNDNIKLDINIDKEKCLYIPRFSRKVKKSITKDYFRMPKTPLHIKIKNIFTGEDNE